MDFFTQQDFAKRKTTRLVSLFALALLLITACIHAVVVATLAYSNIMHFESVEQWLLHPVFLWTTLGTLGFIAVASLVRILQLSVGGAGIAESVGARRVSYETTDLDEQKFINVVEEMSLASGTPIPSLFIMDGEMAINAFVAGKNANNAILVVTQGCLQKLNREELQGVVGHEFSHIFNKDMQINLKLIGLLAGIMAIGVLGRLFFSTSSSRRHSHSSSRRSNNSGGGWAIGLALIVIGFVGTFFGRLIKAAISRQREYLADASAVQYTRDPDGIAGALQKIQNDQAGSLLESDKAEEMSHMCFGVSFGAALSGWFATHPPLDDRIKAINPLFRPKQTNDTAASQNISEDNESLISSLSQSAPVHATKQSVMDSIGHASSAHIEYVHQSIESLPDILLNAAHDLDAAMPLIFALITAGEPESSVAALEKVRQIEGEKIATQTAEMLDQVKDESLQNKFLLMEIASNILRSISDRDVLNKFRKTCVQLMHVDKKISLYEFVIYSYIRKLMDKGESNPTKVHRYAQARSEIILILSLMSEVGEGNDDEKNQRFDKHLPYFFTEKSSRINFDSFDAKSVQAALARLAGLTPMLKRSLIEALVDCILEDDTITQREALILRAVCIQLDCPLPPIIGS
jgi:Zn-dependent protease with chaperone function